MIIFFLTRCYCCFWSNIYKHINKFEQLFNSSTIIVLETLCELTCFSFAVQYLGMKYRHLEKQ